MVAVRFATQCVIVAIDLVQRDLSFAPARCFGVDLSSRMESFLGALTHATSSSDHARMKAIHLVVPGAMGAARGASLVQGLAHIGPAA